MATTLAVRIVSDASAAGRGFDDAESRVDRFNRRLDQSSVVAGGVITGLAAVGKEAFDSASRLEQAGGAIESVYGQQAAAVDKLASTAAQRVGLATASYSELSAVLGSQLQGMGFAGDELVGKQETLIQTGADLAATFGGDTSQAVSALSSLLRGERDPIERYGIAINQAAVDAKVQAMGLDTSTDAAARAAQAQATLALVQEQSAGAAGAFSREADTAAGQTQRAAAEFENAKAALGDALLPVVSAAAGELAGLAGWVGNNVTTVGILAAVVGGLAVAVIAVNAAVRTYRAIAAVATAAQWLWNVAMSMNPIGLIVIAVLAVIAIVVTMYNKFEWFRTGVKVVADLVMGYINMWKDAIGWVIDKLSFIGDAAGAVSDFFSAPDDGGAATRPGGGGSAGGGGGVLRGAGAGFRSAAAAPVRGASLGGGGSVAAGGSAGGGGAGTTVYVTVQGAVDPVATGRQLVKLLKDYGVAVGSDVAFTSGRL
jgi:hypothetical protein